MVSVSGHSWRNHRCQAQSNDGFGEQRKIARVVIGADFDPLEHDSARILKVLRDSFSARIGTEDKKGVRPLKTGCELAFAGLWASARFAWAIAEDMRYALFQEREKCFAGFYQGATEGPF
jgi:hypothetical protein